MLHNNINNALDEVARLVQEENMSYAQAIEKVKKTHNSTDQSKNYEHNKINNLSLASNEDFDNTEIYNMKTGQTVRELEG